MEHLSIILIGNIATHRLDDECHANIARQQASVSSLMGIFLANDFEEESLVTLAFSFSCENESVADQLIESLEALEYLDLQSSNGVVTGQAGEVALDTHSLHLWITWMNQIASYHECDFLGWAFPDFSALVP